MKRFLSALLCAFLLIGLLSVPALAWEKPLGSAEGSQVSELKESVSAPDMTKVISKGLTFSDIVTEKVLLATKYNTPENPQFTPKQRAELGNQFKYGFSAIGVGYVGRPIGAAIDNYFATGSDGSATVSGMTTNGAMALTLGDRVYNVNGESVPADSETIPAGYAYRMMMTFNFGKIANIESFGMINTWANGIPQGADFYVSDDGTTWKLVGYYDRSALRLSSENSKDYAYQDGALLGTDEKGNKYSDSSKGVLLRFDLPAETSGQFFRVAFTAGNASSGTVSVYGANLMKPSDEHTLREMFVWGTLTDKIGYTYKDGDGDYKEEVSTGEGQSEEATTAQQEIATKPNKDKATEKVTEKATEAEIDGSATVKATETQATEKTGSGCGSAIAGGFAVIASIGGALVLCKRKRS